MKALHQLLHRLGGQPRRSLRIFVVGLGLFICGMLLIGLGYFTWPLLQMPGLLLLAIGGGVSAWGYVGILANRFVQFLSR